MKVRQEAADDLARQHGPELLKALKALLDAQDYLNAWNDPEAVEARRVIAKAEGRADE